MRSLLPDLRVDSAILRRAARFGAVEMPDAFARYSPPLIGAMFALALPSKRARVADNLRWVGARADLGDTVAVFARYALVLTEAFAASAGRRDPIVARVIGDDRFQKAKARGRGVIIATAHTSGWYAAGPILGSVYDEEVVIVMQPERDASAQALQDQAKQSMGMRIVHVGADPLAAMPLLAHLKKGGVVAMQMDRVPAGQRAVDVTLSGRPFQIPEGPFALAAVSGAPLLLVVGRRTGHHAYEIEAGEPIVLERRPSRDQIQGAAQALASQIERYVRAHPRDWFHFG